MMMMQSPVPVHEKATLGDRAERRVRFRPSRYGEEAAARTSKLTTAAKTQRETNQIMREQLRLNKERIRQTAEKYSCPLLRAAKEVEGVMPNDSLEYLLATQMKQVAVASDGHQYDFAALRAHIIKGMLDHRGPLSPITKRPLEPVARYTAYKRDSKTGIPIEGSLVTKVWHASRDYDVRHMRTSS